jgi:hypothetical protein
MRLNQSLSDHDETIIHMHDENAEHLGGTGDTSNSMVTCHLFPHLRGDVHQITWSVTHPKSGAHSRPTPSRKYRSAIVEVRRVQAAWRINRRIMPLLIAC